MNPPTEKQLDYLANLLVETKRPASHLARFDTFDKAQAGIDELQRIVDRATPIKDATRAAVFARLRETSFTKSDMYLAAKFETLSRRPDGTGATEADAKRCLRFLKGELVEHEPKPSAPEADALGEAALWVSSPTPPPPAPAIATKMETKPRRVISVVKAVAESPAPPTLRPLQSDYPIFEEGYRETFWGPDRSTWPARERELMV